MSVSGEFISLRHQGLEQVSYNQEFTCNQTMSFNAIAFYMQNPPYWTGIYWASFGKMRADIFKNGVHAANTEIVQIPDGHWLQTQGINGILQTNLNLSQTVNVVNGDKIIISISAVREEIIEGVNPEFLAVNVSNAVINGFKQIGGLQIISDTNETIVASAIMAIYLQTLSPVQVEPDITVNTPPTAPPTGTPTTDEQNPPFGDTDWMPRMPDLASFNWLSATGLTIILGITSLAVAGIGLGYMLSRPKRKEGRKR